jgi:hypothetical protein
MTQNNPIIPYINSSCLNTITLGSSSMGVKLKDSHLNDIIDALELVVQYKSRALRKTSWETFENQFLISAIEQINANEFILHHPQKNFFMWLIDQCVWARIIVNGVPLKEGTPIIDTRLGERVSDICRAAAKGQLYYDSSFTQNNFHDLFDQ